MGNFANALVANAFQHISTLNLLKSKNLILLGFNISFSSAK